MLLNLKALIVVLVLAGAMFRLAQPICLRYMNRALFTRRRNTWFLLTCVAFVCPNFWLYAIFALVVMAWNAQRDDNPLALYVLITFTIPDVHFYIPGLLVQQLFDLSQYRMLSLAILLPTLVRVHSERDRWLTVRLTATDVALLGFLFLQIVSVAPYESVTNTMRRGFLFLLDTYIVYFAFSRLSGKDRIDEVVASFWLACLVMAPVAIFEWSRSWLLYTGLAENWGDPNVFAWLLRGDSLRAQAAANHAINLGYLMAVSIGFFLYLRQRSSSALFEGAVFLLLATALFAAGARGPWLTAALIAMIFAFLRPGSARKLAAAGATCLAIVAVMYLTPLREIVLDRLPFIGTADQETVTYRQHLAELSYSLIALHPWFGDPFVARNMESLKQGQGIIDIVNGYLYAALFTGLVGLGLFASVLVIPTTRATQAMLFFRRRAANAVEWINETLFLGAALVATMLGTMFFIATAGYGTTTYILAGLLTSYAGLRTASAPADRAQHLRAPVSGVATRSYNT